jgi:serine/threonine protein phosphatase 1
MEPDQNRLDISVVMATIAIGDIHGNLSALEDLLGKVVPTLSREDVLVFLGDYIDRGPDSRGCVDRIVRLKHESQFSVITLKGNHEEWMIKTWRDSTSHSWIFTGQGFSTIESYSREAGAILDREIERYGPRLITERISLPYEVFFNTMPREHLAFLDALETYHQTGDVVCVHGGVALDGRPVEMQDAQELIWGPDAFPDQYQGRDAVVYGHWDNSVEDKDGWPWPCTKDNQTFGIDTISKGVLTAMRFPEGKIFQSARYLFADPNN